MRIYIKGDYARKVQFGYRELAWKMWFKERNGQEISFSHVGDDEMLQDDFYLSLRLNKWGASGSRWKDAKVKGGSAINSQKYENIDLDYEGSYESDGREKGEYLRIASNYLDVLTVDKRAMYIMALEIATAIDGKISEDDKKTWLTIEEFKEKHHIHKDPKDNEEDGIERDRLCKVLGNRRVWSENILDNWDICSKDPNSY